jgi:hypothetical protein
MERRTGFCCCCDSDFDKTSQCPTSGMNKNFIHFASIKHGSFFCTLHEKKMILQMRSTAGAERYGEFHYKVTNTCHSLSMIKLKYHTKKLDWKQVYRCGFLIDELRRS